MTAQLRHSLATWLLRKGFALKTVAEASDLYRAVIREVEEIEPFYPVNAASLERFRRGPSHSALCGGAP